MSCLRDFVEEELSFGSSYGKGGGGALTPWIPQSHNVKSWNHSENNESHLKIDPVEYDLTDKKPFLGKTRWATYKLAQMHTGRVETVPVGHWEYVSAHYSLPFQISALLGFICEGHPAGVRSATQTEGIFILKQQSVEALPPAETGKVETGEKWEQ